MGQEYLSVVSLRAKLGSAKSRKAIIITTNNIHSATGNGDIQDTTGFSKFFVVDVGGGTKWEF
ncbi:hypothetical protein INT82_05510 [Mannheimia haemolytica]|nr:hypothetical protein [Mannheimia haemolytica]